jgi:hypothetical protein
MSDLLQLDPVMTGRAFARVLGTYCRGSSCIAFETQCLWIAERLNGSGAKLAGWLHHLREEKEPKVDP